MKDSCLTLRLPRDWARALVAWSRKHGMAKSVMVREAVAACLAPPVPPSDTVVTAGDVAARWGTLPHLRPGDAAASNWSAWSRVSPGGARCRAASWADA